MTKEKLSRLADLAGDHARTVRIKLQMELMPSWVLINKQGACDIIGTPWRDSAEKDAVGELMRRRMREQEIVAYSLTVEAWAAQAPEGWKLGDPYPPNRTNPDRREIVIAFATDGEHTEWRQWAIKRDYLERAIALEPIDFEGAQARTWMTGLLKP